MPLHELLTAVREGLTTRASAHSRRPLSRAAIELAHAHRIWGALYHISAPLGELDALRCRSVWAQNAASHLRRIETLRRIWPPNAPDPLIFKGADLLENLYDDPGARYATDLDLLLPGADVPAVARALARHADAVIPASHERFGHEAPCSLGFRVNGVLLELHRDPQPAHRARLSGGALYARSRPGRLGGMSVRYPEPIDRALLWLTNQAKDAFFGRLSSWLDLALITRALADPLGETDRSPHGALAIETRAEAAGLSLPWRHAQATLGDLGLLPGKWSVPARAPRSLAARIVAWTDPCLGAPPSPANRFVFQLRKLALLDAAPRRATLQRAARGTDNRRLKLTERSALAASKPALRNEDDVTRLDDDIRLAP